ncbi:MAG: hypothetical protein Q9190_007947 [Brigantiaea leucoxantha]
MVGLCFLAGDYEHYKGGIFRSYNSKHGNDEHRMNERENKEGFFQPFNQMAVGTSINHLILSTSALLIPCAFLLRTSDQAIAHHNVANLSRATSILLIISYGCYLVFAYKTHNQEHEEKGKLQSVTARNKSNAGLPQEVGATEETKDRESQDYKLSVPALILTLLLDSALLGFCTTFTGDSIDGLTEQTAVSQGFVGLILIPILGCNLDAISLAKEGRMQQSFEITINSSLQDLLLILPLVVLIDWMRPPHDAPPLTLSGVVLLAWYCVFALCAWFDRFKALHPDAING